MRIDDKINVWVNTAFKKIADGAEIYSGHSYVKIAKWTRENGFEKISSVSKGNLAIPCPVIAIVDKKIRNENLNLRIYARKAQFYENELVDQYNVEFERPIYKTSSETIQTDFIVPRFTRKNAMFLLSGLGNQVYEIYDVQDGMTAGDRVGGGEIGFYALTSEGSKVLWYLGMDMIHNLLLEIVNGIWAAPTECLTCGADGVLDNGIICPECGGYGYSGYNATKNIQIKKGYDVRLTRNKFDSYPVSDSEDDEIRKFVNKIWTQKWWVTPTISEIKRMFAHFYNVGVDSIIIEEIYHAQMPHWNISIPFFGSFGTPFTVGDIDLLKFIAETVTPAGVNVFFGFYSLGDFGNLDDILEDVFLSPRLMTSIETQYALWGDRWGVHNGWCECVDNFESGVISPAWNQSGNVSLFETNDISRNVCLLSGNASMSHSQILQGKTGFVECWIHPLDTTTRMSIVGSGGVVFDFIEFRDSGFYNNLGVLERYASKDCDYHINIHFDSGNISHYVDRILIGSGVHISPKLSSGTVTTISHIGGGVTYFDNFGIKGASGYSEGDNWTRIGKWGWGKNHVDSLSGLSGLYEKVFRRGFCFDAYGATKYP